MSKLFYFTDSYPYGLGESWKTNELKFICKHFDKVNILPLQYRDNKSPIGLPAENTFVYPPVFENLALRLKFKDLFFLLKWAVLSEFFRIGLRDFPTRLKKCLSFVKRAEQIKKSPPFHSMMKESVDGSVWYFFWAVGWSNILPFIKIPDGVKVVIRLHGYDLYLDRNDGYIPFRNSVFDQANFLLPVSDAGRRHLLDRFHVPVYKVLVSRLGTLSPGKTKYSQDGCLRLLSCSSMIPLKRLDRIIDALKLITDISIIWVHIGDGVLRQNLQSMCKDLPANIKTSFVGQFKSQEVLNYYIRNQVDLFINTSSTEGVPVAVMEALSAGIPVFATNVGGTSEIIDNSVGLLLDTQPDPSDIAKGLKAFFLLPEQNKQELRNAAFKRFQDTCDAEVCTENLLKFLK